MNDGGWTLLNEILYLESLLSSIPLPSASNLLSADLTTYTQKPIRLTSVISSNLLKDFKGSFNTVKAGFGLRCSVGADDPTMDPVLNYLCQINNRNGLNTYVAATFSSYVKYWLY
ncbi:predicted protein [Naegleria gruberi]|uniref:Predicted protein n=1 Tax=Naegleria gruberi TaxID=5762 RepID=D2VHX9_NAEGR|nr:uncharacterized protein NAEGRDRAFT_68483 [Naegleria gruberi]EFC43419.1 predicted protein [Naegleria gruberi]|eukprot:XP_002676163.1 predicted protein [Naegleria gruberi strain NEG-M]